MHIQKLEASEDLNPQETSEWLDSLDEVIDEGGPDRASYLLQRLNDRAAEFGVTAPLKLVTPYINTIPERRGSPVSRRPADRAARLRTTSAGMLSRWSSEPTRTTTTSAGTSPPTLRSRR